MIPFLFALESMVGRTASVEELQKLVEATEPPTRRARPVIPPEVHNSTPVDPEVAMRAVRSMCGSPPIQ